MRGELIADDIIALVPLQGLEITEKSYDLIFSLFGLPSLLLASVFYAFRHISGKKRTISAAISFISGVFVFLLPTFSNYLFITRIVLSTCCACLLLFVLSLFFNNNDYSETAYTCRDILYISH
jgi:hypothetical protein